MTFRTRSSRCRSATAIRRRPPAPGVCIQATFDETSRSLVIEDACPFQLDRPAPLAAYSALLPE
jgi:hypothetical protein